MGETQGRGDRVDEEARKGVGETVKRLSSGSGPACGQRQGSSHSSSHNFIVVQEMSRQAI